MRACASQSIESVYSTEDVLGTYVPIVYIIGIYVLYVSLVATRDAGTYRADAAAFCRRTGVERKVEVDD